MSDKLPLNRDQRRHPETAPAVIKDVIRIDIRPDGIPIVHTATKNHLVSIDLMQKSIKTLILAMVDEKKVDKVAAPKSSLILPKGVS